MMKYEASVYRESDPVVINLADVFKETERDSLVPKGSQNKLEASIAIRYEENWDAHCNE